MAGKRKALKMLKQLPRITEKSVKPLPGNEHIPVKRRGLHRQLGMAQPRSDRPYAGMIKHGTLRPYGVEYDKFKPAFFMKIPRETYYQGEHLRRQYPPVTLLELQRLIDLGRINPEEPIDLTTICNTKIIDMYIHKRHYGINLTDKGADIFCARVNIEVQWASELTIAAVERAGGRILTRFLDLHCVDAMRDPEVFFRKGSPIPRCKLPPLDAVDYYSSAQNRGYLADPAAIEEARHELAQKYGYRLPQETVEEANRWRKDPRQIWHGLEPGWVINLTDKTIIKPKNSLLQQYYRE